MWPNQLLLGLHRIAAFPTWNSASPWSWRRIPVRRRMIRRTGPVGRSVRGSKRRRLSICGWEEVGLGMKLMLLLLSGSLLLLTREDG